MTDVRRRAIDLYDAFTHDHRDRRTLMRDMVLLAGSAAAAEALIASIAASPATAQVVRPDHPLLRVDRWVDANAIRTAYVAIPRASRPLRGAVMVIHENRGLTAHIEDVTRRIALAGFYAIAPDFLAGAGGTPADENVAREMIGKLDLAVTVTHGVAMLERLRKVTMVKAGAVGFCWGGAMVNRLAVASGEALSAGVSYYGPAPAPAEAGKVRAAMMLQLAGNDARVNATAIPWGDALAKAGRDVTVHTYPGVEHAFNNDTSAARYNAAAAALAWDRTLVFFRKELARS